MIIITGNKGFVGNNLTKYLKRNNKKILGVSRNPNANEINYSQLKTHVLNKSKAVIHLAGKAHDLKKISEDNEYFEANTKLTKIIFSQFLESTCEVFVYMSSVKAIADSVEGMLTEDTKANPVTPYGKSKLKAEEYILSQEIPINKRVYILRPCMIHGPNNKGNLNVLYNFVKKGIPYPFGQYVNQRSFLSVYNLSFVINEFLENRRVISGIYNVADDGFLSTNDLVKLIGENIGKKVKILNIPKFIVRLFTKTGDILPLPVNSEKLQKLTENYRVSNSKLKKVLQKELPLTTEEGLKRTIKSF